MKSLGLDMSAAAARLWEVVCHKSITQLGFVDDNEKLFRSANETGNAFGLELLAQFTNNGTGVEEKHGLEGE